MAFSPPEYCRLFAQKRFTKGGGGGGHGHPRNPPSPSYTFVTVLDQGNYLALLSPSICVALVEQVLRRVEFHHQSHGKSTARTSD